MRSVKTMKIAIATLLGWTVLLSSAFVPYIVPHLIVRAGTTTTIHAATYDKSDVPVERKGDSNQGEMREYTGSRPWGMLNTFWPRMANTLDQMERELGVFPNLMSPFGGSSFSEGLFGLSRPLSLSSGSLDLKEDDKSWTIVVDIPGVKKEDIKVSVDDSGKHISISAEKFRERDEKNKEETFHVMERGYGSISRSLRIPDTADEKSLKAVYKDGVLTINMEKKTPTPDMTSGRVIDIQ